jgi:ABC-2 type transport system ATP-binding protein
MATIKIDNLSYTIPYGDTILKNINLTINEGNFIGILGQNGTGKTTLLDIIMGFRKCTEGTISVIGEDPHAINRAHKENIIFLSQDVALKGNLTIDQFLKFHSAFYKNFSVDDAKHLMNVFSLKADMKIGSLSTGQQKKVQIIAGLSSKPKLIIIDEITAVLDPETRDIFFRELEKVRQKYGCAIVLATNIAEDLINRVDSVYFIQKQKASMHSPLDIMKLFNIEKAA